MITQRHAPLELFDEIVSNSIRTGVLFLEGFSFLWNWIIMDIIGSPRSYSISPNNTSNTLLPSPSQSSPSLPPQQQQQYNIDKDAV